MATLGSPGGASNKEAACQYRRQKRQGSSPWVRKIPGEGHGNPLRIFAWRIAMDRGAWPAIVHGVTKESDTTEWLSTAQGSSIFSFLRISILFPIVAIQIYIPTNSFCGFLFLHTLQVDQELQFLKTHHGFKGFLWKQTPPPTTKHEVWQYPRSVNQAWEIEAKVATNKQKNIKQN